MRHRWFVLLLAVTLPMIACERAEEAGDEEGAQDAAARMEEAASRPGAPEATTAMTPRALPDTTAAAVWSHLRDASYREQWRLWPGKGELYEGTEPHGMLLTTYLNERAYAALTAGDGPLPAGSIVVKENYTPDSTLAAVTVMYTAEGYDAEHDDLFWAKYTPDGGVDAAGRVESCQACHAAGERGYLRTPDGSGVGASDGG